MSQRPNQPLRWVELDQEALDAALREHATTSHQIDLRADGYGFGADWVASRARELGLDVGGEDDRWAQLAYRRGAHRFSCTVVNVKSVPAGASVSYGGHYRVSSPTRLALCTAGFADGVPRLDPVGGEVSIRGTRVPIAGRIAMDQLIVDLGELDASVGDQVTVWGAEVSIEEWAGWSGRDVLAIGATLSPRVVRSVVGADHG